MSALASTLLILADFDGHMDWDDGWGVVMIVGMILFWALVILGIVWIVRELTGRHGRPPGAGPRGGGDEPLAILDRRFAEGTISADEYRERRAILTERDGGAQGAGG